VSSAAITSTVVGAVSGAVLGSIPGYLIDKARGAAVGALLGGTALALVGFSSTTSSSGTGTSGLPRGMGGLAQLMPQPRRR